MSERFVDLLRGRITLGVMAVSLFTGAYLLAAIVAAIVSGNSEFTFYIAVMLILAGALFAVHIRLGLTTPLLWALSVWGGLHMAGGLIPVPESWPINGDIRVLYSWWIIPREGGGGYLKFDHVAHAYGFAVATWATWQCLSRILERRAGIRPAPTFGILAITFAAGCGWGALNELVEFIATRITTTNVGGYENTGWDLVSNTVGALVAVIFIRASSRAAARAERGARDRRAASAPIEG
jgi:hypothetical protein